jgi:hypothetical protein
MGARPALTAAERMRRYRARRRAAGLRLARTWQPRDSSWSDHRVAEARSLAMHVLAARRLAADPSLVNRARATVRRWRARHDGAVPAAIEEWVRLLERPWREVAGRATALTEEGARLRQSSPLAALLSAADRRRIHDAFRA